MLKEKDCILGLEVGTNVKSLPVLFGKIAGYVTTDHAGHKVVVVEWVGGNLQKVALDYLITAELATKLQTNLQADRDKLEMEFQLVVSEIAKKMTAAAQLIEEAGVIATKAGKNLSYDFYDQTSSLENAMERAGWNTSSWTC